MSYFICTLFYGQLNLAEGMVDLLDNNSKGRNLLFQVILQVKYRLQLHKPQHIRDVTHDRRTEAKHQVHRLRHRYLQERAESTF